MASATSPTTSGIPRPGRRSRPTCGASTACGENTITNFNFTTHALNVYRLPEVLEWAESGGGLRNRARFTALQDYVLAALVHHPAYMSVRVLPDRLQASRQRAMWPATWSGGWPVSRSTA